MAKISQILSILSFVISISMLGGTYFGYKYLSSEQFKNRVMNEVLANVQQMMPKMLDKQIPKTTGKSIPEFIKP
jgi:peroxiredoxin family protein|tara:strand:- start:2347 stop:2568 length:222 start_codon:yes stop_codon:yes gene_type:complete